MHKKGVVNSMETMNYNRDNKKNSKAGIICFVTFAVVGTAACFYMINNEPKPKVLGQDMYINTSSKNVDIYEDKIDISKIEYSVKNKTSKSSSGKFKSSIQVPVLTVNQEVLNDINEEIFNKFAQRYNSVKSEVTDLENSFTYKVTFNKYESIVNNKRLLSFTFYERIVDNSTGEDVTYKLYGYTIDLATKSVISQDDAALIILGSTYKNIIKGKIKDYAIGKKLFTSNTYSYILTGFEEFYVKEKKLHIMFNVGEMGNNKDYIDIIIK